VFEVFDERADFFGEVRGDDDGSGSCCNGGTLARAESVFFDLTGACWSQLACICGTLEEVVDWLKCRTRLDTVGVAVTVFNDRREGGVGFDGDACGESGTLPVSLGLIHFTLLASLEFSDS